MTSLLEQRVGRYRVSAFGCEFTVLGLPQPGGSKKAFAHRSTGRVVTMDANPKARGWKDTIAATARPLMGSQEPFDGPLMLVVEFFRPRPKSHYGARGALKPWAPRYPTVKPDATKLLRPLEDALTGVVWKDDAQIVEQIARKRYGEPSRAEIKVVLLR